MFAVEINFKDGTSESVLVKRPFALIGSKESSTLIIEDMSTLSFELQIVRDVGRSFRTSRVSSEHEDEETLHEGQALFELGPVSLTIICLDTDLQVRDTEPPDRAGVRILRNAVTHQQPKFPAILVLGKPQMIISFDKTQPVYIGRSKQCAIRLETLDLSSQHARVGYDNEEFWVEDLGSTNGTFVNEQQISGRVKVQPGIPIVLGRDTSIMGILSEQQLRTVEKSALRTTSPRLLQERRYPALVSVSEVTRPARLIIPEQGAIQIGRDPTSDLWIGAPHVSRQHLSVRISDNDDSVIVSDQSTNGTGYDRGILRKGESIELSTFPTVFDFGEGITLALCFNEVQEQNFINTQGSKSVFHKSEFSISKDNEVLIENSVSSVESKIQKRPTGTFEALNVAYERSGRERKIIIVLFVLALILIVLIGMVFLRHTIG